MSTPIHDLPKVKVPKRKRRSTKPLPVHQAVVMVMRDVKAIAKKREVKPEEGKRGPRYKFRSVDDAMNAMHGPQGKHGVIIVPKVVGRTTEPMGDRGLRTLLRINYRIIGPRGDQIETELLGEASDFGDKGVGKAMSYGLKLLLFEVFMIPIEGMDDPDYQVYDMRRGGLQVAGGDNRRDQAQDIARQAATVTTLDQIDKLRAIARTNNLLPQVIELNGKQGPLADCLTWFERVVAINALYAAARTVGYGSEQQVADAYRQQHRHDLENATVKQVVAFTDTIRTNGPARPDTGKKPKKEKGDKKEKARPMPAPQGVTAPAPAEPRPAAGAAVSAAAPADDSGAGNEYKAALAEVVLAGAALGYSKDDTANALKQWFTGRPTVEQLRSFAAEWNELAETQNEPVPPGMEGMPGSGVSVFDDIGTPPDALGLPDPGDPNIPPLDPELADLQYAEEEASWALPDRARYGTD
ncbi:ERF family protein [Streptomyces hydrogenans]|uniref:ERF family protein n=1 Tax=Streptomyces hydrogenans TaxID=1873719 RepID=UPI0038235F2F